MLHKATKTVVASLFNNFSLQKHELNVNKFALFLECELMSFLLLPLIFLLSACPLGFFKVSVGHDPCLPCPAHSHAPLPGSRECVCQNRYYRSPMDNSDAPCTGKYLDGVFENKKGN